MILTRGHDIRPDHNDILHSRLHTVEDAFTKGARARAPPGRPADMAHGAVIYYVFNQGRAFINES